MKKEELIEYKKTVDKDVSTKYYAYTVLENAGFIKKSCSHYVHKSHESYKECGEKIADILKLAVDHYRNEDYDKMKLALSFYLLMDEKALDEKNRICNPDLILKKYAVVSCNLLAIYKDGMIVTDDKFDLKTTVVSDLVKKDTFVVDFDKFMYCLIEQGYNFDNGFATFNGLQERAINNYPMSTYITVDFKEKAKDFDKPFSRKRK